VQTTDEVSVEEGGDAIREEMSEMNSEVEI
jgi:hypothetical protein